MHGSCFFHFVSYREDSTLVILLGIINVELSLLVNHDLSFWIFTADLEGPLSYGEIRMILQQSINK